MSQSQSVVARPVNGIRINALAATVMLLLQFALGIWVNIYATLPSADSGAGFGGAFFDAVSKGPVALALHAILGTLLVVSAVALVVRTVRVRRSLWTTLAVVGLTSVVVAWLSGDRFVDSRSAIASLLMAWCTALALLCYALVLFTSDGSTN